jgi:hypothetical protein
MRIDWRRWDAERRAERAAVRARAIRLAATPALRKRCASDLAARTERARARRLNMSVERYRSVLGVAARSWCLRYPWRVLPRRLALLAYRRFGRAHLARVLQAYMTEEPNGAS